MPDEPVVLVIDADTDRRAQYAEWLDDDYTVRTAPDVETALWHFDDSVDVVLFDRALPDVTGETLLEQLTDSNAECRYAMLSDEDPGFDLMRPDVDECVVKPVGREGLLALVDRLEGRSAAEDAVGSYLAALWKKRALESELSAAELASDSRYRSLSSEVLTRRRQLDSLFDRLEAAEIDVADVSQPPDPVPIYKSRSLEFYGLWLLAALTYGLGDIVSTVYAVFAVPGVDEANPVVDALLVNFGIGGFLFFKLLVFFVLLSISVQGARTTDRFSYYWPPVLATVVGTGLTLWNLSLIL